MPLGKIREGICGLTIDTRTWALPKRKIRIKTEAIITGGTDNSPGPVVPMEQNVLQNGLIFLFLFSFSYLLLDLPKLLVLRITAHYGHYLVVLCIAVHYCA